MTALLNAALVQAGWLACILGAASGNAWLGPLAVAGIVSLHLAVWGTPREWILIGLSALGGTLVDSSLQRLSLVGYAAPTLPLWLAPWWITAMWANVAIAPRHALSWLEERPWTAAIFGMLGGPLAYFAGSRLGAVDVLGARGYAALAAVWCVAMPVLMWLSTRLGARYSGAS